MPRDIVILGGPGDGIVVAEAVRAVEAKTGDIRLQGFLNDALAPGTLIQGVPVLGPFEAWADLSDEPSFVPAIHKVGAMRQRVDRLESLNIPRDRWFAICHPTAVIARDAMCGRGVFIASHVTVQPGAQIGDFATIRAGANVGHDAILEDFAYLGPNASLCGRSVLGRAAHLGPNGVLLDRKRMGAFAVGGIGAAITKNVPDGAIVMGNPARIIGAVAGSGETRR